MNDGFHTGASTEVPFQHRVVTGNSQQTEANHQHAGDSAALEGNIERFVETDSCGLGRAHVGANRDVHADIAGSTRKHGTDNESNRRGRAEENPDNYGEYDTDNTNRSVLAVQIGLRAFLNGCGNCLHAIVARRLGQNPLAYDPTVGDGGQGTNQRKHQSC